MLKPEETWRPLGRIISKGPSQGKYVFLKSDVWETILADDSANPEKAFEDELSNNEFLVVDDSESL